MLDSIISAIDSSSPQRKTLLTPSFVNPGVLKRNLALKTGKVANLSVQTFAGFMVDLAIPLFSERLYVAGDRRFWLLFELLKVLEGKLKYFSSSVQFEGFCTLLGETMDELRLNNVTPPALEELPNKAKWNDVALVLSEYEKLKAGLKLFDYPDAVQSLLHSPQPLENVYALPHPYTGLERQLADRLGIVLLHETTSETSAYELSAYKVDTAYQEALETVRSVITDMEQSQVPVRIGICTPDYDSAYYTMVPILERIKQEDLIHFVKGEPLLRTSAGTLWKYLCEWVANDFSVYRLIRVLGCTNLNRTLFLGEKGKVEPSVFLYAVRLFSASELVVMDAAFLSAFRHFVSGRKRRDADEDQEKFDLAVQAAAVAIAEHFAEIPAVTPLRAQLDRIRRLFVELTRIHSDSDAAAVSKIEALIDSLLDAIPETAPDTGMTITGLLAAVNDRLQELHVNSALPDFTRPVLGTINDLKFYEFDRLYMLGLNEKGLPSKLFQNPILLDEEKNELAKIVPDARLRQLPDRMTEDDAEFRHCISRTKKKLILSAPLKDLSTGRELLVSRYLLDTWNQHEHASEDYKSISTLLGRNGRSQNNHVATLPEHSIYDYELGVAVHVANRDRRLKNASLANLFPLAASAGRCLAHRKTMTGFDEYWGVITTDPKRDLPVFSASRIRNWTSCPYQYFMKYELRLDSPEDYNALSLDWLDPMAKGSFLHDVFFRFFVKLRASHGEQFSTVNPGDEKVLRQVFDEVAGEYAAAYPVTSPVHHAAQLNSLRRDAELFFRHELKNNNVRLYFELAFHMPDKERRDALKGRSEPAVITLADGTRLLVRGSIDRVDKSPDGRHILYDYKTGKARSPKDTMPFDGGELIQAGLYSEVVSQIDPAVTRPMFRFYYATENAGFADYTIDYPKQRGHFIALLSAIIKEIRSGNFVPGSEAGEYDNGRKCDYCDFSRVCIGGKRSLMNVLRNGDEHRERLERIRKEELLDGLL